MPFSPRKFSLGLTAVDLSLIGVAMLWGSSYPAVKFVLSFSSVILFIFLRFSLTALFMLPIFVSGVRGRYKETVLVGAILGILLFLIFYCETAGVKRTLAVNAAFFISLCVLFTPLIESAIVRTFPRPRVVLACAISCLGAGLMGATEEFEFKFNDGDMIIMAAAFLRALGVVATKRLMANRALDSGAVTFIQMLVVALISGAWILILDVDFAVPTDTGFWLVTLYLVVFCTLIAFYTQTHMIGKTSPTHVVLIMGTEPLFGAVFAVLLLQEGLSLIQYFGGVLIVMSTYVVIKK
ncbi:DMT family transporter [Pseudomonas aeruginosa]|uniref:DMT family transporter n=1 Tax=Pseudomonas aeruginosa TaxID=287 RepID=UPI00070B85F2|nr:DMT family transporter [Pseudomonas aeruginosa]MCT4934651.1 DMT family transporter [Pseudomonas aeruginosa]QTQ99639.1 DMT family transporter [Pseudomonas aeruginosa]HCD7566968.1 DMT family transporter [Pseudomonas aeruginosa]HCD7570242.1 DMT family transporter [Pseudomonas aeruginosa]HCZ9130754.1 DMT family transporter [Pseudomonas aeruginosa]